MKVIVREVRAGLYLTEGASWKSNSGVALQFEHATSALQYCMDHRILDDIELLPFMDDPRMTTPLPLVYHGLVQARSSSIGECHAPSTTEA